MLTQLLPLSLTYIALGIGAISTQQATQGNQWLWLIGWLPLAFMLFLVAPYKLWKEQRERADQLEIDLQPSLKVVGSVEQRLDQMGQGYAIEIENIGKGDVKKCHGRLLDLKFETTKDSISLSKMPRNRDLHWSGQVENADHYDVPGSQPAILNVVYCSRIEGKQLVRLAYRSKEQFRRDHALPQEFGSILALIRVSYEGHEAINLVCRIDPKMMADTAYRAMSSGKPFELKWYGTETKGLDSF